MFEMNRGGLGIDKILHVGFELLLEEYLCHCKYSICKTSTVVFDSLTNLATNSMIQRLTHPSN